MLEIQICSTIANTTSASHSQSERSTTSGNRLLQYESIQVTSIAHSEEPSNPQLDNYAQPEDLISKPHLPKQRFEGENTVHKVDCGGVAVHCMCECEGVWCVCGLVNKVG